jgi:hypothetical protein
MRRPLTRHRRFQHDDVDRQARGEPVDDDV